MHPLSVTNTPNDPVYVDYLHIFSSFPQWPEASTSVVQVAGTFCLDASFLVAGGADFFPAFEVSPHAEPVNQRNMFKQVLQKPDH